ncbi:MAG: lamin tail domain-containing protein, partial [Candidatus Hinthialibacter sp.]
MMRLLLVCTGVLSMFCWTAWPDVVITELHYNPPDDHLESGAFREFIELYNPETSRIDLSGYYFDDGIRFTFPEETWIEAGSYLVLAKDPSPQYWRNKPFHLMGPYDGYLADGGERLTLNHPDGVIVETFQYSDEPPWPRAADGYGFSLERIAWHLPAADHHSWRSSFQSEGTPGARNSVHAIPPFPLIQ